MCVEQPTYSRPITLINNPNARDDLLKSLSRRGVNKSYLIIHLCLTRVIAG